MTIANASLLNDLESARAGAGGSSRDSDGNAAAARGCRQLELRGIPPGMFPETDYESQTVQLERGDSVILLSDGFSEWQNSAGAFFGMERVQEVCESLRENHRKKSNA